MDFHLSGTLPVLVDLFSDRILMSDFVESELAKAETRVQGAHVVILSQTEEWSLFEEIKQKL